MKTEKTLFDNLNDIDYATFIKEPYYKLLCLMNIFQIDEFKLIEEMYPSSSTTDELAKKRYVFKVKYHKKTPKFNTLKDYYNQFIEILKKNEDFKLKLDEKELYVEALKKIFATYDNNQLSHLKTPLSELIKSTITEITKEDYKFKPNENELYSEALEKKFATCDDNQISHLKTPIDESIKSTITEIPSEAITWLTKAKEILIKNYDVNILNNNISIDNNTKLNVTCQFEQYIFDIFKINCNYTLSELKISPIFLYKILPCYGVPLHPIIYEIITNIFRLFNFNKAEDELLFNKILDTIIENYSLYIYRLNKDKHKLAKLLIYNWDIIISFWINRPDLMKLSSYIFRLNETELNNTLEKNDMNYNTNAQLKNSTLFYQILSFTTDNKTILRNIFCNERTFKNNLQKHIVILLKSTTDNRHSFTEKQKFLTDFGRLADFLVLNKEYIYKCKKNHLELIFYICSIYWNNKEKILNLPEFLTKEINNRPFP